MQVYGIDLSKEKFDANFIDAEGKERNLEVKNAVASVSRFLSSVSGDSILCAEHTGAYGDLLVYLCNQMNIPIALVPGYTANSRHTEHSSPVKGEHSICNPYENSCYQTLRCLHSGIWCSVISGIKCSI